MTAVARGRCKFWILMLVACNHEHIIYHVKRCSRRSSYYAVRTGLNPIHCASFRARRSNTFSGIISASPSHYVIHCHRELPQRHSSPPHFVLNHDEQDSHILLSANWTPLILSTRILQCVGVLCSMLYVCSQALIRGLAANRMSWIPPALVALSVLPTASASCWIDEWVAFTL